MIKRIKQFATYGVFAVVAILLAMTFLTNRGSQSPTDSDITAAADGALGAAASSVSYSFILDDDEDGLTNAEEFLYGSDPELDDTDDDGYLDGTEIDNGFDPRKPGSQPQDRLAARKDATLTLRYLLWARDITGKDRPKIDAVLVDQFFEEINALEFALPNIPDSQIVQVDSSARAVASYLQQTAQIELPADDISYDAIASDVLERGGTTQLSELARSFDRALAAFAAVPTPPEAMELQKTYIGVIGLLKEMFLDVQHVRSDPVRITLNQARGTWLVDVLNELNLRRDGLAKSIESN